MVRTGRVRGDREAEFREDNLGGESWRDVKIFNDFLEPKNIDYSLF